MTITRCYAINRDIDGDCPGSMCHSARWHSATFRRSTNQREKALTAKKCLKGGSEYSRIFIFKISIGRRIFLRNTKNGHFEQKSDENKNNDKYCEKQSCKRRKIRSLLSWQQRTIRHLSTDIGGEGGFSGGRNTPRNPPGTQIGRDKSVISGILRERRLGPPKTVYVKGLYKNNFIAARMS